MYTVTLTSEQYLMLLDILDCTVADLHTEIVHTDNRCMKDALKDRKYLLQEMLESLRSLQPHSTS